MYDDLVKWSETREVVLCALCNEYQSNDDAAIEECGLETGDAYSLLDARCNLDVKLVCLREPFGQQNLHYGLNKQKHILVCLTWKIMVHFGCVMMIFYNIFQVYQYVMLVLRRNH